MKQFVQVSILCFLLQAKFSFAQQLMPLSNFMNNQLVYNPASAGMHEAQFNLATVARLQWVGIADGSPKVGVFWTDYRSKKKNMAVGVNIGIDAYGGYKNTDANLNYAYYLNLTKKLKLSMGLRAGFSSMVFSTNKFEIWDEGDQVIDNSGYKKVTPKVGLGFQLNGRNAYIGIASGDFVTAPKVDITGDTADSYLKRKRNINLLAGSKIKLGDLYNFRQNLGVFYYPDSKLLVKINATFEIKDYFWAGLTYSTNKFAAINLGTNISSRIRFGYAYDLYVGSADVGLNSHEINLMLKLDNLFRKGN